MADIDCTVGNTFSSLKPFFGDENLEICRTQLELQFRKPFIVRDYFKYTQSNVPTLMRIVAFPECKEGAVFVMKDNAKQCADSLSRITGYSHSVRVVREASFFSEGAYQLMAMCAPKTK